MAHTSVGLTKNGALPMLVKKIQEVQGMWRFSKLVAILFIAVLYASPVSAEAIISGPPCVIDGNTIQIGGKIKDHKCWGGIDVRLHGSIAPKLTETCTGADGNVWGCGQKAKDILARMIGRRSISCYHIDGEFKDTLPIVTCISGRRDLALEMVMQGMAKAMHDQSKRYALEENDAKQAKRGLWK
ncbi:MAG: thermonuclease family protein [Rhodospirillales bacterium]|nr:thermonuclease family protein [Rhodospirillales bacterium]MDP6645845.1 thermonuclease family protein [Rhodospirillales bacterium]